MQTACGSRVLAPACGSERNLSRVVHGGECAFQSAVTLVECSGALSGFENPKPVPSHRLLIGCWWREPHSSSDCTLPALCAELSRIQPIIAAR